MPAYIDQSLEPFHKQIHIGNLPNDVNSKQITDIFDQFGIIIKLYLKHRMSKNSPTLLPSPFAILIFENREIVDKIMAKRPFFINDYQLFVRRCLPITRRYPYEGHTTTNKMLVRIPRENHNEILPNNNIITEYLKSTGGQIIRLEKLDEKASLVEFEDYDSVDICCLSRPHFINNQMIEIEKCADEQQARRRIQYRLKSRGIFKISPPQSTTIISPTLTLNNNEQVAQLQLIYRDTTNRFENEHEQLISSLQTEWEQIAKKRIRLQRLTLDYQQKQQRLKEENRQLKKLYNESLQEIYRMQNQRE
ncbi:unnamed protein product [Adineta steineri]|uniref:RRM domain-containing protein n=1 Tax=Adineta steineri TaxID=433720 RepID=A0A814CUS9_9BILA|nr:unnamed protein product [Adineta steineri]CAF1576232.1 unnamed protein product [Adineta steineri]